VPHRAAHHARFLMRNGDLPSEGREVDGNGRILRAQVMVSEKAGCTSDEALGLMALRADALDQSLIQVANDVIDGRVRLD
jgi:AmiR/NasT family two-component response regulator